jgi:signal transduction histidine kinase
VPDPDDLESDAALAFGHDEHAPADARRLVGEVVDPQTSLADDIRLAVSELVTNAVTHTDDGGEVRIWVPSAEHVRLEVEDTGDGLPAVPVTPPEVGGRGLAIVEAVSERWGVDRLEHGKVVWAEFEAVQQIQDEGPSDPPPVP